MKTELSVIIAHRYPLDRMVLRQALTSHGVFQQIAEVISWPELLWSLGHQNKPSILLLDLALLDRYPLDQLSYLSKQHNSLKVIVIAHRHHRVSSNRLRNMGVHARITTRDSEVTLMCALDRVNRDMLWFRESVEQDDIKQPSRLERLSAQELRVLEKIDEGLMNKQIASDLEIALSTTKVHVCSILRKLGVRNRIQALMFYRQEKRGAGALPVG